MALQKLLVLLTVLTLAAGEEVLSRRRADLEANETGTENPELALEKLANQSKTETETGNKSHAPASHLTVVKTQKLLEEEIEMLLDSLKDPSELDILENLDKELSSKSTDRHDPWNSHILESQLMQWVKVAERLKQAYIESQRKMNESEHAQNETKVDGVGEVEKLSTNGSEKIDLNKTGNAQEETGTNSNKEASVQVVVGGNENATKSSQNKTVLPEKDVGSKNKSESEVTGSGEDYLSPDYDKLFLKKLKQAMSGYPEGKSKDKTVKGGVKEQNKGKKKTKRPGNDRVTRPTTSGNTKHTGTTNEDYYNGWEYPSQNSRVPNYDVYEYPEVYHENKPSSYFTDYTNTDYPDYEDYYYYGAPSDDDVPYVKTKSDLDYDNSDIIPGKTRNGYKGSKLEELIYGKRLGKGREESRKAEYATTQGKGSKKTTVKKPLTKKKQAPLAKSYHEFEKLRAHQKSPQPGDERTASSAGKSSGYTNKAHAQNSKHLNNQDVKNTHRYQTKYPDEPRKARFPNKVKPEKSKYPSLPVTSAYQPKLKQKAKPKSQYLDYGDHREKTSHNSYGSKYPGTPDRYTSYEAEFPYEYESPDPLRSTHKSKSPDTGGKRRHESSYPDELGRGYENEDGLFPPRQSNDVKSTSYKNKVANYIKSRLRYPQYTSEKRSTTQKRKGGKYEPPIVSGNALQSFSKRVRTNGNNVLSNLGNDHTDSDRKFAKRYDRFMDFM